MTPEFAQFESLIHNLMSQENAARLQAEETYESIQSISKVPLLMQTMNNVAVAIEVRSMTAVLLRRLFLSSFEEFWPLIDAENQTQIKLQLLLGIQQEQNPIIQKKMCECVAEFARNLIDDEGNNQWPEMLKFLFDCASSLNTNLKESSLLIFSIVPGIFGSQQMQYLELIRQMLHQCITDAQSPNTRLYASKAAAAFILSNEGETHVFNHFKDLLPFIIQRIVEAIEKLEGDDELLKCLIDLAETTPKYLKPQLDDILHLCLNVMTNASLADEIRQLGLEVIITLSESSTPALKKNTKFLETLIPQILTMMVDIEEVEDWAIADEIEEDNNDSNSVVAEGGLDRLACALGGKTMLPYITHNIPQMLANPDWKYRHAGLMAISACGEGCHKQMETILGNIVDFVLPFINDQHPRVRYAACNALGQMSTDFGPTFQKKFHQKVVTGLLQCIDSNYDLPRVQTHAAAALVNFSEDCPKKVILPYLDLIMDTLAKVLASKFKELLEKGSKLVLEQIVTTMASVADKAEEKFEQYYDKFMPYLKHIVLQAATPELKMLRGKTIECISLIGIAVGREKFMRDCGEIMELLFKTQTDWQDLPDDDPQISYMISAWARMCKILGKDFLQYLPHVMGPVIKAASFKPELAVLDNDDMKVLESDNDWQFVTLGEQQNFGIRTAGLEEKATACEMLVCYARELKEGFVDYVEEVVKIMVPHLKFYFHDGVRIAAAESLPCLLECAAIRGNEYVHTMWQFICPELLKAIEADPELLVKAEHMTALAECIKHMGVGCLSDKQVADLVQVLDKILTEHFKGEDAKKEAKQTDEDYDEDENDIDDEPDEFYVISKLSDIIHAIFSTYTVSSLPFFDQLLPQFSRMIEPQRPWQDRQWGLCIFDDLIEFAGQASHNYNQHFLHSMLTSLVDQQPEIRQASAYGVGVMAMKAAPAFNPAFPEAIPLLARVINDASSRAPENISATENAIAAVGKICKYAHSSINAQEVIPLWMSWLPVWEDEEEAEHVYAYLCELVENNDQLVLGSQNQNIPQIVRILAEAFRRETLSVTTETGRKCLNILLQIRSNQDIFMQCVSQLTLEQQTKLSEILS